MLNSFALIYRPPSSNATQFFKEFSTFVENFSCDPSKLLVLGDFNIHVDDCNNADGMRFLNLIGSLGLQNHVTSATHIGGHALD